MYKIQLKCAARLINFDQVWLSLDRHLKKMSSNYRWPYGPTARRPSPRHGNLARPKHNTARLGSCPCRPGPTAVPCLSYSLGTVGRHSLAQLKKNSRGTQNRLNQPYKTISKEKRNTKQTYSLEKHNGLLCLRAGPAWPKYYWAGTARHNPMCKTGRADPSDLGLGTGVPGRAAHLAIYSLN